MTTLEQMASEVEECNLARGWYDQPVSFGVLVALAHSELSEALEAYRRHGWSDVTHKPGLFRRRKLPKPEGVGSELADVFIRTLDICNRYSIDLDREYRRKIAYNKTRKYRHGGKKL